MDILRVPSFNGDVAIDVPDPLVLHNYVVEDLRDGTLYPGSNTSNQQAVLHVAIPRGYDAEYKITVEHEDVDDVYVTLARPYVDPNTVENITSATDIANYAKNEEIARAIIDSVIPEGFYYKKHVIETSGLGTDYLPLWVDAKKVLKVYENNVLVYDAANPDIYTTKYEITKDRSAITFTYTGAINRSEGASSIIPAAAGDIIDINFSSRGFARTYDYKVILEVGYKNVPSDIARASSMLIDDLACGRLEYFMRGIGDYNTDQFKLKLDSRVFEGTGNIIVDKILSKYAKSIRTVGVL